MTERQRKSPALVCDPVSWRETPAWLRERLLPRGADVLMIVAYVMILLALASFIVLPSELPPWRFYGVVLSLLAILALNLTLPEQEARFGEQRSSAIYLLAAGALFLLASGLGLDGGSFSFLPYVQFLLIGQAFTSIRTRYALVYSLGLLTGWLAILWGAGVSLPNVVITAVQMSMGMLFTALFGVVIARYREQTGRAEALLEQLRAMNSELAAARERERDLAVAEERVRLAREIHDGLGHHLTVLNVQLQAATRLIERDQDRAAAALSVCRQETQAALTEVRRSVAAMRSSPLDGRTLDESLQALARDFERTTALPVRFEIRGVCVPPGPAAAITLYRAAQEGLTNIQKHAAARQVTIVLDFAATSVRLTVQNDGASDESGEGSGFGLIGLRERAIQLGGDFSAGPLREGGFLLELALPMNR